MLAALRLLATLTLLIVVLTGCHSPNKAEPIALRAVEAQSAPHPVHMFLVQGTLLSDAEFIELDRLLRERPKTIASGTAPKAVLLMGSSTVMPGASRAFDFSQQERLAKSWPAPVYGKGNVAIESAEAHRATLIVEGDFSSSKPLAEGAPQWKLRQKVAPRYGEPAVFTLGKALEGPDAMDRRAEIPTRHELMLYVIVEAPTLHGV